MQNYQLYKKQENVLSREKAIRKVQVHLYPQFLLPQFQLLALNRGPKILNGKSQK
jgi:hypothetical protein